MPEKIIVESKKPVRFEPYCVCCGRKTRGRHYFDSGLPLVVGLLLPLIAGLLGQVWVPFCFKCRWRYFLPGPKAAFHIVFAIVFICMSVCLVLTEWYVPGILAILAAFVALFIGSRQNQHHRTEVMPFSAEIESKKITYIFTAGHYYDKQMQTMDEKDTSMIVEN